MSMAQVIHQKRKELGYTQEQVANFLGVTTPAVNKWEKGQTYPDIAILPVLARLLKTDLNTLMCFQESLTKEEIYHYIKQYTDMIETDGFAAAFQAAMDKIKEYPHCTELIHTITTVFDGALIMSGMTDEQKQSYQEQIFSLYERLAESDDPKTANGANFMLASKLIQKEEYENAQVILNRMPEWDALDKRGMQAEVWAKTGKPTEAAKLLERTLLLNFQQNQVTLISLVQIAMREGDEQMAMALAECGKKESEAFGLWDYNSYVVPLETAILRQNVDDSIHCLKKMFQAIMTPCDMSMSPLYQHMPLLNPAWAAKKMLVPLLAELEQKPKYEFLRSVPEFQQMMEEWRSQC